MGLIRSFLFYSMRAHRAFLSFSISMSCYRWTSAFSITVTIFSPHLATVERSFECSLLTFLLPFAFFMPIGRWELPEWLSSSRFMTNPDNSEESGAGDSGVGELKFSRFGRKAGNTALDGLNFSWSFSNGHTWSNLQVYPKSFKSFAWSNCNHV